MILLSDIVSKKVLNIFSGRVEGTVKNLCFDEGCKIVKSLKVFNDEDDEFSLDAKKIYCAEGSAIVIKNSSAITPALNQCDENEKSPMNLTAYSLSGDDLGLVVDAELSNSLKLNFLITKTHRIRADQIINVADNVIVNLEDKKVRVCDFKPRVQMSESPQKVYIVAPKIEIGKEGAPASPPSNDDHNITPLPPPIQNISNVNFKISALPSPQKIVGNSNFLIGRKMARTIYGLNNEIIIRKEFLINEKTIDCARKHGKLMELTMFSKQKA